MTESVVINIERTFSKYPAGRYVSDGPYSGEAFREEHLLPALRGSQGKVIIELDGARGYGSSFLEEAFGGLLRKGVSEQEFMERVELRTSDRSLREEILLYVASQAQVSSKGN